MRFLAFLLTLSFQTTFIKADWVEASHFNALVYHHVAEDTPASTSISPTLFRRHLQLLQDEGFQVIAIEQALTALQTGAPLPPKAVVLTFDDAYANIYHNAFPLLQEFGYPFTIFVATDAVDQGFSDMLSWQQLQRLQDAGVTLANHSSNHVYLARQPFDAPSITTNILNAQKQLESNLQGPVPRLFAYPYGEYHQGLKNLLAELGFIAFAQHSGGVYAGSDFLALPRFAAAGIYANPDTLLVKLNSHPMPVDYSSIPDMLTIESQPVLNLQLSENGDLSKHFNCFINGQAQAGYWLEDDEFSLQTAQPLSLGRHRYNCTAKSLSEDFYYWFSQPWLVMPRDEKKLPKPKSCAKAEEIHCLPQAD